MADAYILLADNDPDSLALTSEYLESVGYKVLKASSPSEARDILEHHRAHLIILDMRLIDDDNDKDRSGLTLAKEVAPSTPKIILTKFPTYQDVREAMRLDSTSLPPAIDFLNKLDGLEKLEEAVKEAFSTYVRISWDLIIKVNDLNQVGFLNLLNLIEPGLEGGLLLNRAEELEDLFRHLFYEKNEIRIDRLLWQREGRIAVSVFAFAEGKAPESLIVVCGQNASVMNEARRYREHAPRAPGPNATVLVASGQTTHFAANAYTLAGAKLENVHSLAELYRSGSDKALIAALKTVYERTLTEWHQEKRILEENRTIDELYRERLGFKADRASQGAFKERVQALVRQIPTLGVVIECVSGSLIISFGEQSFSYPDPTSVLYQSFDIGRPALLMNSPGILSGENILSDAGERVWVTDFAAAGLAPLLWNFVALEAAIRFDWIEASKLQWIHDLDQYLLTSEFSRLDTSDIEAPLRKPMKAIHFIRTLAFKTAGRDPINYNLGILFQAASRIVEFNPTFRLTPNELARLAHVLIASAMICGHVMKKKHDSAITEQQEQSGIRIDKVNRVVWVGGARVLLSVQSYNLLCNLYDHPNQLRTRRELIEQVLREKYDELDKSQISRLNMAIHRLREKIQDDPEKPRYLVTQPGGGYRLVP
jgi:DNA-binding response OmpR family regulator